jgi:hypothetical protein
MKTAFCFWGALGPDGWASFVASKLVVRNANCLASDRANTRVTSDRQYKENRGNRRRFH